MFPSIISKAATVDVINNGEGDNRNGAVQLVSILLFCFSKVLATKDVETIAFDKRKLKVEFDCRCLQSCKCLHLWCPPEKFTSLDVASN